MVVGVVVVLGRVRLRFDCPYPRSAVFAVRASVGLGTTVPFRSCCFMAEFAHRPCPALPCCSRQGKEGRKEGRDKRARQAERPLSPDVICHFFGSRERRVEHRGRQATVVSGREGSGKLLRAVRFVLVRPSLGLFCRSLLALQLCTHSRMPLPFCPPGLASLLFLFVWWFVWRLVDAVLS